MSTSRWTERTKRRNIPLHGRKGAPIGGSLSNLLEIAQHLFYGPGWPRSSGPLLPKLRGVTKRPGGADSINAFEKVET